MPFKNMRVVTSCFRRARMPMTTPMVKVRDFFRGARRAPGLCL